MAHVGSDSAFAGSSLTRRPAASAGLPCDSSAAMATIVKTAAAASLLSRGSLFAAAFLSDCCLSSASPSALLRHTDMLRLLLHPAGNLGCVTLLCRGWCCAAR